MGLAPFIQTIYSTNTTSSGLLDGTGKQMLNSRGKIYNVQELKTLVRLRPLAQRDLLRHLD